MGKQQGAAAGLGLGCRCQEVSPSRMGSCFVGTEDVSQERSGFVAVSLVCFSPWCVGCPAGLAAPKQP